MTTVPVADRLTFPPSFSVLAHRGHLFLRLLWGMFLQDRETAAKNIMVQGLVDGLIDGCIHLFVGTGRWCCGCSQTMGDWSAKRFFPDAGATTRVRPSFSNPKLTD